MSGPTLRPARAGDFEALYGEPPAFTIKAYAAEIDGRVVGIGGIQYIGSQPVLFSRMADELRPFKKFIVRSARLAGELAREAKAAAVANPNEPRSCHLLRRLGLTWVGTVEEGEVFSWRTQ